MSKELYLQAIQWLTPEVLRGLNEIPLRLYSRIINRLEPEEVLSALELFVTNKAEDVTILMKHLKTSDEALEIKIVGPNFRRSLLTWADRFCLTDVFFLRKALQTLKLWANFYPERARAVAEGEYSFQIIIDVVGKDHPKPYYPISELRWGVDYLKKENNDDELIKPLQYVCFWRRETAKEFRQRELSNFKGILNQYINQQSRLRLNNPDYIKKIGRKPDSTLKHYEWLVRWNIEGWSEKDIADFYNTLPNTVNKALNKLKRSGLPFREQGIK